MNLKPNTNISQLNKHFLLQTGKQCKFIDLRYLWHVMGSFFNMGYKPFNGRAWVSVRNCSSAALLFCDGTESIYVLNSACTTSYMLESIFRFRLSTWGFFYSLAILCIRHLGETERRAFLLKHPIVNNKIMKSGKSYLEFSELNPLMQRAVRKKGGD